MMTLIITSRRRDVTRRDQAFYFEADCAACRELAAFGPLRWMLRRGDDRGVVFLVETSTRKEALGMVEEMPTVSMGASSYLALAVDNMVDKMDGNSE